MSYRAPLGDYRFAFRHVLALDRFSDLSPFRDLALTDIEAILEGAAAFCEERLAPVNIAADREGSRLTEEGAFTATGVAPVYREMIEGGWVGLEAAAEHGGAGLPSVVAKAVLEMRSSASMAIAGFAELTEAVYLAMAEFGTPEQKRLYLRPLACGRWAGAMHLTEPQAGSDIGLIRTVAAPQPDGSYRIRGSKIFISDAEQDLTENVVNLVLARIEGAPPGTRGLSLFIAPRRLVDAEGRPFAANAMGYISLEHKMGLHGSVTGTMVYEEAHAFLIGEVNQGLAPLFAMVNETRLGVGLQGLAAAERARQAALAYARERVQGRVAGLSGSQPLIRQPDVQRMLLEMAAFVEGGRLLGAWTALQMDVARASPDETVRREASARVSLMTPLIKTFFSDEGFGVTDLAIQVHGGHGYIRDTGVEQFFRDARLARIYEGANGIVAYDLARRKICADGGAAMRGLIALIEKDTAEMRAPDAAALGAGLLAALEDLAAATDALLDKADAVPDLVGAVACDYVRLAGLCMLGWMWTKAANAIGDALAAGTLDTATAHAKTMTARFFIRSRLGETGWLLKRIAAPQQEFDVLGAFDPIV